MIMAGSGPAILADRYVTSLLMQEVDAAPHPDHEIGIDASADDLDTLHGFFEWLEDIGRRRQWSQLADEWCMTDLGLAHLAIHHVMFILDGSTCRLMDVYPNGLARTEVDR